ncbi:hypothetical protein ACFLZJ_00220 [Nanoarchaeota archaeon]
MGDSKLEKDIISFKASIEKNSAEISIIRGNKICGKLLIPSRGVLKYLGPNPIIGCATDEIGYNTIVLLRRKEIYEKIEIFPNKKFSHTFLEDEKAYAIELNKLRNNYLWGSAEE